MVSLACAQAVVSPLHLIDDNRHYRDLVVVGEVIGGGAAYEPIVIVAGDDDDGAVSYHPHTSIRDQARIALDHADLSRALDFFSFDDARAIYERGGNSFSVATVTTDTPLPVDIMERSVVSGVSETGDEIRAFVLADTPATSTKIDIVYPVTEDDEETGQLCQVGGKINPIKEGCEYTCSIIDSVFPSANRR